MRSVALPMLALALLAGCKIGGAIANVLGDVVGETKDVSCDRRTGAKPAPFCQEVLDTVAVSQVGDDCKTKFSAVSSKSRCPRDKIIAGCKLHTDNDDGSEVWDWYYDVADASSPDGGDAGFTDPPQTKDDVKKLCADKTRYDQGADFDDTP